MEIKQLEIFACVAKKLSFSKAAQELYMSQPTVSAQINALEKKLGAQLFLRNTKGASLTKTGADFLIYVQKILVLRDQAVLSIGNDDRSWQGSIDIISSTIPAQYLLPEVIAVFQKQWSNILFRVEQADSRKVMQGMSGFQYDFGMTGTVPDDERFVSYPIYNDELVLILPKHFQQELGSVREHFHEYILNTPFIMREYGSGTRAEIENLLSKLGVDPNELRIPAYFSDTNSILLAVTRGMGISLVSKVAAKMYEKAGLVETVELSDHHFMRHIYLMYNKELWLSPAQQAFVDHAKLFYAERQEAC